MARTYSMYLSVGTNKYGTHQYGPPWEYGINTPPPQPLNIQVLGGPAIVDQTPIFSWTNPTFSWELEFGDGDQFLYELQISYNDPTFSTWRVDTDTFESPSLEYTLPPQFELDTEGVYYVRVRSTDGYTWSDWSENLRFLLYLFGAYPPGINTVTSPADGYWQLLTGNKGSGQYVFLRNNGGAWISVDYPDGLSGAMWSYNLQLTPGTNFIEVLASLTTSPTVAVSPPSTATIELVVQIPEVYNIWNCFDEFGLLLGLPRILGEKNADYKERLLDVYTNPANSTYSGLINGISRELGLSTGDISIEKLSDLMDPTYSGNLLNDEGHAIGTKLVDYANEVYDHNPIFWGNVVADESYWDGVDEETNGYNYLPHIWDPLAIGIYGKWQTAGIGDNDDLWVKDLVEVYNDDIDAYSWYLRIHSGYFYSCYPSGVIGA